jgi:dTDP-4-amino-4,6-dideoxygalactose transaminase
VAHTFHRYVIRVKNRKKLLNFLTINKIEAKVHYERNIHQQVHFKKYLKKHQKLKNTENFSKQVVSLPINQFLSRKQILFVITKVNYFFRQKLFF